MVLTEVKFQFEIFMKFNDLPEGFEELSGKRIMADYPNDFNKFMDDVEDF